MRCFCYWLLIPFNTFEVRRLRVIGPEEADHDDNREVQAFGGKRPW